MRGNGHVGLFAAFSVVVAVLVIMMCSHTSHAGATTQATPEAHIAQLQAQRIELLRDGVTSATHLFEHGAARYGEVFRRKIILYEAQLELAQTHTQRMELLQQEIDAAKALEEYEELLFKGGTAQGYDVNDAKAERLKYEIALAKETAK